MVPHSCLSSSGIIRLPLGSESMELHQKLGRKATFHEFVHSFNELLWAKLWSYKDSWYCLLFLKSSNKTYNHDSVAKGDN